MSEGLGLTELPLDHGRPLAPVSNLRPTANRRPHATRPAYSEQASLLNYCLPVIVSPTVGRPSGARRPLADHRPVQWAGCPVGALSEWRPDALSDNIGHMGQCKLLVQRANKQTQVQPLALKRPPTEAPFFRRHFCHWRPLGTITWPLSSQSAPLKGGCSSSLMRSSNFKLHFRQTSNKRPKRFSTQHNPQ